MNITMNSFIKDSMPLSQILQHKSQEYLFMYVLN